ncbi:hypothetical protein AX769_02040 [Frondihabitans sp. PAMC 28766]|uniref:hypothetical protein n=1 Tax=Frondihabitans sp. PAMC 28766 TaxID=1795630 RepID=UPI00078ED0B7|nr:hypothetical protein [Frondihabitans sp. PAMC 28766]AMM19136.1 hypothetical protein AX769_02040 [Frondihabitans sp. PAMC 28766]
MDSILFDPITRIATPLPLEFHVPPGWPTPSPDWRAANQGWQPPAAWTPLPGLDPVPAGWQWWQKNVETWAEFVGREAPVFRLDAAATLVISAIGLLGVAISLKSHADATVLFAGLAVFGPLNFVRLVALAATTEDRALRRLRSRSARLGWALALLGYEARRGSATAEAESFDTYVAWREQEAWSFDRRWDADQVHPDLRAIFNRYCRAAPAPCHRVATAALAGVSGGALVITVLVLLANHVSGSGSSNP